MRTDSGTPYNAVEFFPRIAKIWAIEINDGKCILWRDNHISNMIIAMLIALRSVGKQITVIFYVFNNFIVIIKFNATSFIFFNFIACLTIKATAPFFLLFGG